MGGTTYIYLQKGVVIRGDLLEEFSKYGYDANNLYRIVASRDDITFIALEELQNLCDANGRYVLRPKVCDCPMEDEFQWVEHTDKCIGQNPTRVQGTCKGYVIIEDQCVLVSGYGLDSKARDDLVQEILSNTLKYLMNDIYGAIGEGGPKEGYEKAFEILSEWLKNSCTDYSMVGTVLFTYST